MSSLDKSGSLQMLPKVEISTLVRLKETNREFQKQVVDAWRDINEEFLRPTVVPMPLLMCVLNLSRVMDVIYTGGDGYTHVGKVMKNNVASLLIHSIV
uniref:Sesquiterpene synthase n=1 Tax=Vitis vinifera TaxID=29760 RepID=F6HMZ5_VITVI